MVMRIMMSIEHGGYDGDEDLDDDDGRLAG